MFGENRWMFKEIDEYSEEDLDKSCDDRRRKDE